MGLFERHQQEQRCRHEETVTTTNFGLERTVCLACGKVEMRHLATAAQAKPQMANR